MGESVLLTNLDRMRVLEGLAGLGFDSSIKTYSVIQYSVSEA